MTDAELGEVLGAFRRVVDEKGAGGMSGWPKDHPVWALMVTALTELRNWRTLDGLLRELVGECEGGDTMHDPHLEESDFERLGVLQKVPFDPAVHKDTHDFGPEPGDDHWVMTPAVAALFEAMRER